MERFLNNDSEWLTDNLLFKILFKIFFVIAFMSVFDFK